MDNGLRSISDITQFCTMIETILRPHGLHVALTGSFLYGMGTGKDVDVLIYAHCGSELNAAGEFALRIHLLTMVTDMKPLHSEEYTHGVKNRNSRKVWSGTVGPTRVDFIVLTEA